jgi:hypothetical protein
MLGLYTRACSPDLAIRAAPLPDSSLTCNGWRFIGPDGEPVSVRVTTPEPGDLGARLPGPKRGAKA